jgi:hypothetical protein
MGRTGGGAKLIGASTSFFAGLLARTKSAIAWARWRAVNVSKYAALREQEKCIYINMLKSNPEIELDLSQGRE